MVFSVFIDLTSNSAFHPTPQADEYLNQPRHSLFAKPVGAQLGIDSF